MKNRITLILGILLVIKLQAQTITELNIPENDTTFFERMFNNINSNNISTGILIDKIILVSPKLAVYTGETDTICQLQDWRIMYHQLYNSHLQATNWQSTKILDSEALNFYDNQNVIPIGFLDVNYNRIKENAIEQGLLQIDVENGVTELVGNTINPYEIKRVHAYTCLKNQVAGNTQTFVLSSQFNFSNVTDSIKQIEIDFNDGLGWISIEKNLQYNVNYSSYGKKFIRFKTTYNNNVVLFSTSELEVIPPLALARAAKDEEWLISADISYNGNYGSGKAYIIYGCGNTTGHLRKPFVLVEGFDARNNHDYDYLYDKLLNDPYQYYLPNNDDAFVPRQERYVWNKHDFINKLRNNGYDVVMLDFTEGTTYMQKNAYVLVKLIQMINADKALIGSTQPLVVAGASMGGVVCRFALTYMEKFQAITGAHQTRLFISFDSPQSGANIVIGIQHIAAFLFKHKRIVNMADPDKVDDVVLAYNTVNAYAAQQLLRTHYTTNNSATGEVSSHLLRNIFMTELKALGNYPQQCRKVAVVNGNIQSVGQPFTAGAALVDIWEGTSNYRTGVYLQANAIQSGFYTVFYGYFKWQNLVIASDLIRAKGEEIDNAPGGSLDIAHDFHSNTLNPYSCFIPSVSALDVTIPTNLGPSFPPRVDAPLDFNISANISSINSSVSGLTPFDAYYGVTLNTPKPPSIERLVGINPNIYESPSNEPPASNQQHVSVNISNVDWAMQEIIAGENSAPLYVQNKQIVANEDFVNKGSIFVGKNVTTSIPVGDVVVKNGVTCNMISSTEIVFRDGFIAESGSNFHAYINSAPIDINACNQLSRATNNIVSHELYYEDNTWQKQTTQTTVLTGQENKTTASKSQSSINSTLLTQKITIYPNPNKGEFVLEISNAPKGNYSLQITDAMGRSVIQQNYVVKEQNLKQNINLQAQGKGIYFVKINSEQINEVRKIVVE